MLTEPLLTLAVLAALVAVLRLLLEPPDRVRRRLATRSLAAHAAAGPLPAGSMSGILPLPAVQQRIVAVRRELQRLDVDPAVFARAFRVAVAREAHRALLADEQRLLDEGRRVDELRLDDDPHHDTRSPDGSGGREVLRF